MTDPLKSNPGFQTMIQAGQAMAQGFLQMLSEQQGKVAAPALPRIEASPEEVQALAALQASWATRHAQLWQDMVQRTAPPADGGDRRFSHPAWGESPIYDYTRRAYALNADLLAQMAEKLPVADDQSRERLRFATRQYIDAMAPSNFAATNPEFIAAALESNGESIKNGLANLIEDLGKGRISMTDESVFEVGRNMATTAGQVVFENELIQLIQYSPITETVGERPFLMIPPCINKFYILDLQPENSFVRYAVEQGNTVFLVSWRNPGEAQSHLTWDDYIDTGVLTAFRVTREITGVDQVNALGFCVGGTLISSALAVARARGDNPAASLTLLTTLLDFSEPGELGCFIDENSVALRENTIGKGGLLPGRELATVFSALRANDLIWQYVVGNYLKGVKPQPFDLLYWNGDATNLTGPFLAWYLRNMYLENNLREPGKLDMAGQKADLGKLDMPVFFFASREDHIVPWKSSYAGRALVGGESTFVLGASGHIAGVINPASKNKRSYWTNSANPASADAWFDGATEQKGSWWPVWASWLAERGGKKIPARSKLGSKEYRPIEPAPGRYVKEKA